MTTACTFVKQTYPPCRDSRRLPTSLSASCASTALIREPRTSTRQASRMNLLPMDPRHSSCPPRWSWSVSHLDGTTAPARLPAQTEPQPKRRVHHVANLDSPRKTEWLRRTLLRSFHH